MIKTKCNNPTFNLSFFDLFIQGLTNLSRQIFFSMQMAIEIAEYNNESEFGLSLGMNEHEFLHDYVKFLSVDDAKSYLDNQTRRSSRDGTLDQLTRLNTSSSTMSRERTSRSLRWPRSSSRITLTEWKARGIPSTRRLAQARAAHDVDDWKFLAFRSAR